MVGRLTCRLKSAVRRLFHLSQKPVGESVSDVCRPCRFAFALRGCKCDPSEKSGRTRREASAHRMNRVEIEIQFQHIDVRFAEEAELPSFYVFVN